MGNVATITSITAAVVTSFRRFMRFACGGAMFMLVAFPAYAQSNPCDYSSIVPCYRPPAAPPPPPVIVHRIPDCMIAQNAMRPCAPPPRHGAVDPRAVGRWVATVNGGLWFWTIDRNGNYQFHSEAGDGTPTHWGVFTASNGHWSVQASTGVGGWVDGGPYVFQSDGVFYVTGHSGSVGWRRVGAATN